MTATTACRGCGGPLSPSAGIRPRVWCSDRCAQRHRGRVGTVNGSTTRTCEVCAASYRYTYARQRTCSRACGVQLRRSTSIDRTCGACAQPFSWAGASSGPTYCSARCQSSTTAPRPRAPLRLTMCAVCDVAFHTNRPQAHCSPACAMVGKLRYDRAYNTRRPKPARSCACGSPLNGRRLKCDACRLTRSQIRRRDKRRRRALKLGVPTERYTLAEIAQRDRRTCQLCRKRVAMTKIVPHPKAPTIDHVVPLADGGSDLRSNVQLAHFLCNSTKSNRGTQQLVLVG